MDTTIDTESKILINLIIKAIDDFRIEESVITSCYGDNPLTDFMFFPPFKQNKYDMIAQAAAKMLEKKGFHVTPSGLKDRYPGVWKDGINYLRLILREKNKGRD